jgi:predicted transcriptional regulator
VEHDDRELILRPDRAGVRMVLGDLEAQIMDVIWEQEPASWCTVREVYERLREQRYIAYTTVMNTMTRLAKKGLLESRRQEQAYLYRPRTNRDSFMRDVIGHVLEQMLAQFSGPTQTALDEYGAQHPGSGATVTALLDEIQARRAAEQDRGAGRD